MTEAITRDTIMERLVFIPSRTGKGNWAGEWYYRRRLSQADFELLNELYGYDEGNRWELIPLGSRRQF